MRISWKTWSQLPRVYQFLNWALCTTDWVQLGPALGKSYFPNFARPQFCGIPLCLAHTHHTCPSKRPGQTLAYPRRLQKLNKSWFFDKVLSDTFLLSDPCHCPYLFSRSRIAEFSLLMDACQRQRIPPRLVLLFRFACSQKLAYPRQLTLNTVSEKLIAESIQRSDMKKGHFSSYTSKKTIDLSFARGIRGIRGIRGSDVADPACRPHSMRRGARMTVVRQAISFKL